MEDETIHVYVDLPASTTAVVLDTYPDPCKSFGQYAVRNGLAKVAACVITACIEYILYLTFPALR